MSYQAAYCSSSCFSDGFWSIFHFSYQLSASDVCLRWTSVLAGPIRLSSPPTPRAYTHRSAGCCRRVRRCTAAPGTCWGRWRGRRWRRRSSTGPAPAAGREDSAGGGKTSGETLTHTTHTGYTHTHLTSAWLKHTATRQHTLTFQEVEQRHVRLLEVVVHVVFPLNHLPKQKEKRELCVVRAETQWELQMIQIVCDSAQQGVHSLLVKCWQTRLSCNEGAAAASQRLRNTCSRQEELLSWTF